MPSARSVRGGKAAALPFPEAALTQAPQSLLSRWLSALGLVPRGSVHAGKWTLFSSAIQGRAPRDPVPTPYVSATERVLGRMNE